VTASTHCSSSLAIAGQQLVNGPGRLVCAGRPAFAEWLPLEQQGVLARRSFVCQHSACLQKGRWGRLKCYLGLSSLIYLMACAGAAGFVGSPLFFVMATNLQQHWWHTPLVSPSTYYTT
jgi:hypothetical protein